MGVDALGRKLGEILLEQGSVKPDQLEEALRIQAQAARKGQERKLGEILLSRGYTKRHHVTVALAKQGTR